MTKKKTSICTKQIEQIKQITKDYPCALGAYFLFHHQRFNGTEIDKTTIKEIIEPQLKKAITQYQLLKENNPLNICPMLDFEFDEYNALPQDGAQKEKAKQNKKNAILYFINLFQKRTGTKIGIFCSYTTYLTFFKDDKNFKNIPLWISHDQKQGDIKSYRKTYQIKPTMLQHSQRTPCTPGSGGTAEGRIDVNTTNIQNLQELLN